jgi:hypothetical protein
MALGGSASMPIAYNVPHFMEAMPGRRRVKEDASVQAIEDVL